MIDPAMILYVAPIAMLVVGYMLGVRRGAQQPPRARGELPGVEPGWYPPTPWRLPPGCPSAESRGMAKAPMTTQTRTKTCETKVGEP